MTEHFTVLTVNESFWRFVDFGCTSRLFCLLFQNKSYFVSLPLTLLSRNHSYNVVHLNLRKHTEQNDLCMKIINFCPTVKHWIWGCVQLGCTPYSGVYHEKENLLVVYPLNRCLITKIKSLQERIIVTTVLQAFGILLLNSPASSAG